MDNFNVGIKILNKKLVTFLPSSKEWLYVRVTILYFSSPFISEHKLLNRFSKDETFSYYILPFKK